MKPRWFKIFFSVAIVYHLIVIVILPNSDSILGRELGPYLAPYANVFGLNTSWRFFSPEPSPAIYYIYDADMDDGGTVEAADNFWKRRGFVTGRWPPDKPTGMLSQNVKRLAYHSRFTTVNSEKTEKFLGDLLCRFYPRAHTISVRGIVEEMPSIENFDSNRLNFERSAKEKDLTNFEFSCPKAVL
jgi:hypothetical protein